MRTDVILSSKVKDSRWWTSWAAVALYKTFDPKHMVVHVLKSFYSCSKQTLLETGKKQLL